MLSIHELQTRRALTRPLRSTLLLPLFVLLSSSFLLGQSVGPAFDVGATGAKSHAAPARLADSAGLAPAAVLEPALSGARDEMEAIAAWNRSGRLPARNGFSRPLPSAIPARFFDSAPGLGGAVASMQADGTVTWTARVRVEGAHRVRLLLTGVELPAGAKLWVYAQDGETVGPFGSELRTAEGEMWTPSVAGPTVTLEARMPGGGGRFTIAKVLELFELDRDGAPRSLTANANENCLVDGRCTTTGTLPLIGDYRHAVAHLQFVVGGNGFICSGGLLNDTDSTGFIPYLLTANHCFSTQAAATSLDAYWDFYPATCNGSFPSLGSLPKSHGSTLLATGGTTDFTFVRLNSIPGGRTLLGWNANNSATANNTILHRLSHPLGYAQGYSRTKVVSSPAGTCTGIPTSNYIYSNKQEGATFPGSSGSPVVIASNLQVVGQLRGGCAVNPNEPCLFSSTDYFIDGRFSVTFPSIDEFLNPVIDTTPCVRTATVSCLLGNRFEIELTYTNASSSGTATVMSFNGQRAENNESAFYYFTGATNFEMGLKVLNACGLNNRFWVFVSGLTDQGWTLTVRDTVSGVTKTYTNANAHLTSTTGDTAAFLCP